MEYWDIGILKLEYWDIGIFKFEYWDIGILRYSENYIPDSCENWNKLSHILN